MRKFLILLATLLMLTGCSFKSSEPETVPTEPSAAVTEPTETEPVWSPYTGSGKGYVYYHSQERDKNWEEDIIYAADSYLENFHTLTRFPSRFEYIDDVEYSDEFYDPQQRQKFIDQINELIPQIPELSDTEILYQLKKLIATLKDAHTSISIPVENYVRIGFEVFYESGYPVYRVSYLPTKYEYAMFSALEGINDLSIYQVIDRLKPYLSYENDYWLASLLSGDGYPGYLACTDLLLVAGVIENADEPIRYRLRNPSGFPITLKLESCELDKFQDLETTGWTHYIAYPEIYGNDDTQYYHYKMIPEADILYVRFNEFTPMTDYPILNFGNDILREARDAGGVKKLVVDLRRNPGGSQTLGFPEFITVLQRLDAEQIYVLIDHGTFSCAILMASQIKVKIPDAIFVGTPAGQPPNFYGGMYDGDYTMPHSEIICRIPTAYYRTIPDYEYDALMPDVPVYPTIEDFADGIDTILEAAKAH